MLVYLEIVFLFQLHTFANGYCFFLLLFLRGGECIIVGIVDGGVEVVVVDGAGFVAA